MGRRRLLAALATLVIAAAGMSACGDAGGGKEQVTLTILEYQQPRADAVAKVRRAFEAAMKKQGRDIKVKLVRDIMPDDQFKTKITKQYNAGDAPDVTDLGASMVPDFARAGYLLDLTPYLEKWKDWKSFYPDIRDQIVQPDGKIYALPHDANTQNLFYRRDVLEKLGVSTEQPATWPELISRLKQITEKAGQPAMVLPAGTTWGYGTFGEGFLNVMLGTGSRLYNSEADKWVIQSPGLTETFELYDELTKNKLLPVEALLKPEPWQPTKYKAFPAGTLPVAAQGTWGWRYDWGPDGAAPINGVLDKVATWDYPSSEGEPYSVSSVGFSYGVSAKSEHPDEAMELAKWLSSGSAMAEQLVAVGAAAPRSGIDELAPYSSELTLIEAGRDLATSRSFAPRPGQDHIAQAVAEATEGILTGKMDGAEAAKFFAKRAEELLGSDQVETGS